MSDTKRNQEVLASEYQFLEPVLLQITTLDLVATPLRTDATTAIMLTAAFKTYSPPELELDLLLSPRQNTCTEVAL
jgi:hypothetical protein